MKAALSAMMVKTDRKDARELASSIRMGWFRRGPRQIDGLAGGASTVGCAQTAFSGGLST